MPHEQRSLQRDRELLDHPTGLELAVVQALLIGGAGTERREVRSRSPAR